MFKKITIFILTLTWVFLFPTTSLAANCKCGTPDVNGFKYTCYDSSSDTDCQTHSGLCTYNASSPFIDSSCTVSATAPGTCKCNTANLTGQGMQTAVCYSALTDAECQTHAGAANGSLGSIGTPCTFDATTPFKDPNCGTSDSGFSYSSVQDNVQLKAPNLEITIPGLSFTKLASTIDEQGNISIPYLGDYIASVYHFAIIAASLVAVVMIILNGFRIAVSAGGENKAIGIKNVGRALIGLFLLWSSYALLYTINPNLTNFKSVKVKYVPPHTIEEEEEFSPSAGGTATTADLKTPSINNIVVAPGVQVSSNLLDPLQAAASALMSQGYSLYVSSGYRSLDSQIALITQNCQNPPGSATCNPKPGRPLTCILKGYNPDGSNPGSGCPHTTGKAVDVWGMKDGAQCVSQRNCQKNASDVCHTNPCQAAVIAAMRAAGFCNLDSEAWHFEQPQMSSACH